MRHNESGQIIEDATPELHEAPPVATGATGSPFLYDGRDPETLGEYYIGHLSAMTAEGLNSESHIASELAWRDQKHARLLDACHTVLWAGKLVQDHIGLLEREAGSRKLEELYRAIDELKSVVGGEENDKSTNGGPAND